MSLLQEKINDKTDLDRLFRLCCLSLPENQEEQTQICRSLTDAADYIYPRLNEGSECCLPFLAEQRGLSDLRGDEEKSCPEIGAQVLGSAPEICGEYFSVPRVVGEDKE